VKHPIRRHGLALSVVIVVAAIVAACGQITASEEAQVAEGLRSAKGPTARLVQSNVCIDGATGCGPTGAHEKHKDNACTVCHKYAGTLSFDKNGPAYAAGQPAPTFDATAKTCSNVACHGVPAGTYYYTFYGEEQSVPYGGTAGSTPSWYATGLGCTACHDLTYQGTTYTWHTASHGQPFIAANTCQRCHIDATGVNGSPAGWAWSTATNCPPLAPTNTTECAKYHANGTVDVSPVFRSQCFNCH